MYFYASTLFFHLISTASMTLFLKIFQLLVNRDFTQWQRKTSYENERRIWVAVHMCVVNVLYIDFVVKVKFVYEKHNSLSLRKVSMAYIRLDAPIWLKYHVSFWVHGIILFFESHCIETNEIVYIYIADLLISSTL